MDDETRERMAKELLETVESFDDAVHDAGGCHIGYEAMKEMTLFQFVCHVAAPNHIRFRFERPDRIPLTTRRKED